PSPSCAPVLPRCSARRFDPFHVRVAEAEMVADLVDQHMAHQPGEILAALAPIIEDRPAVEKDHVEIGTGIADALVRQRDTPVEAEDIEGAVEPHRLFGLLVGELVDADDDLPERLLQPVRDCAEGTLRQLLDLGERWRQAVRHGITPGKEWRVGWSKDWSG